MTRLATLLILLGAGLIACAVLFGAAPSAAAPPAQEATPIPNLSIGDDYCLGCHGQPGQTLQLEDGSTLDLYVDPLEHAASVHGSQGYACVQCHNDVGEYPHPPFSAADRRDVTLQMTHLCARCHESLFEKTLDSVHSRALQNGNRDAAVCVDCHTAHAVRDWVDETNAETLPEARTAIPQTCAQCHNEIYQTYLTSVHGEALTEQNNPDVPTCIDCHGVHNIPDPTTNQFRLASPAMCANCHTEPGRMAKYGLSTQVLDTYVADFHGTTVAIFEKQSPDQETNKPVCYDCHGVHDIKRADDPEKGLQVKENLLAACQRCHPDASDSFPTAWLSHYIPSPDKYPLVYYVDLFYKLLIPTVLGGMAVLVVLDVSRRALDLRKRRQVVHVPAGEPPEEAATEPEAAAVSEQTEAAPPAALEPEQASEIEAAPETEITAEIPPVESIESAEPQVDEDIPPGPEDTPERRNTPGEAQPGEEVDNG